MTPTGNGQREAILPLKVLVLDREVHDNVEDLREVFDERRWLEALAGCARTNHLFYFAIPPSVFVPIRKILKEALINNSGMNPRVGWSRIIIKALQTQL